MGDGWLGVDTNPESDSLFVLSSFGSLVYPFSHEYHAPLFELIQFALPLSDEMPDSHAYLDSFAFSCSLSSRKRSQESQSLVEQALLSSGVTLHQFSHSAISYLFITQFFMCIRSRALASHSTNLHTYLLTRCKYWRLAWALFHFKSHRFAGPCRVIEAFSWDLDWTLAHTLNLGVCRTCLARYQAIKQSDALFSANSGGSLNLSLCRLKDPPTRNFARRNASRAPLVDCPAYFAVRNSST